MNPRVARSARGPRLAPRETSHDRNNHASQSTGSVLMPRAAKSQSATPAGPRLVTKSSRIPSPDTAPPLHEQITLRAYELFLHEGGGHGRDVHHWLRAERELLESQAPAPPTRRAAGPRAKA